MPGELAARMVPTGAFAHAGAARLSVRARGTAACSRLRDARRCGAGARAQMGSARTQPYREGALQELAQGESAAGASRSGLGREIAHAGTELLSTVLLAVATFCAPADCAALGCAAAIGGLVYAFGTQMNPGVSVALLLTRALTVRACVFNVLGQTLGAVLGAAFASRIMGIELGPPTLLANSTTRAFTLEFVASSLLMSVIYNTLVTAKPAVISMGSKAVALAVLAVALAGASCNPALAFARSVGTASSIPTNWTFLVAPIVGCAVAAVLCEQFVVAPRNGRAPVGWIAECVNDYRQNGMSLRRMGAAGLIAYGVLNTLYYSVAFSLFWLRLSSRSASLAEKIAKVWAVTWAGSQITKPLRLGASVALVPVVNRVLAKLGWQRAQGDFIEGSSELENMTK